MVYFMFISKHFKEIQNNQSWRNFSEKNIIHASATDDTSCNVNFCWRLAALGEEEKKPEILSFIPSTRAVRECILPPLGISESFQVASCFNNLPLFGRGPTTITTGSLGD